MPTASRNPGSLDTLVILRRPITTYDTIGAPVQGWEVVDSVWAEWKATAGRETFISNQRVSESGGQLVIRYRDDIDTSWSVSIGSRVYNVIGEPVMDGRGSYLKLTLQIIPPSSVTYPKSNIFDVTLTAGTESKVVRFPSAFAAIPRGVYLQLLIPVDGDSFTVAAEDITAEGFTAVFSAAVPAAGYKLSVQAYLNEMTYLVDITEGESTHDEVYANPFSSNPRGLKVELVVPEDGYAFTTNIVVMNPTAAGFTADFGAAVPGAGYKLLIRVSLS